MDPYNSISIQLKNKRYINTDDMAITQLDGVFKWLFHHELGSNFDLEDVKGIITDHGLKIQSIVNGNGATVITTTE